MNTKRNLFLLLSFLIILALISSCTLFGKAESEEPTEVPIEEPAEYPLEEMVVAGPNGSEVFVDSGALSHEAEVVVEELGEGVPFVTASPFNASSAEYSVDLGEADQIGKITMTVPLSGTGKLTSPAAGSGLVYVTWTEPEKGYPSVVGTIVENNLATFPVVGSGIYQVFSLKSHAALMEMISIFDPLAVPTYPQMTPSWCSPTAVTNLVQFHQGAWPAGGLGSVWGNPATGIWPAKQVRPMKRGDSSTRY